jgi:hypothetical protein
MTPTRLQAAIQGILQDPYANTASVRGWLFSALIDHHFIDSSLTPQPVQRRAPVWQSCTESSDLIQAADDHLTRLAAIADPVTQYAALENLTLLNTPALTQDSFANTPLPFQGGGEDGLNLLILGAGPIGLVLASALKLALGDQVNVLLVDNRVSEPHQKQPYQRRWITNLPHALLHGLVEKTLSDIFARVGDGVYIGCTMNVLESLLLLSCRRMGVKFLFSTENDFAWLEDSAVQLVFDATGNRFTPLSVPRSADEISVQHSIDTSLLGSTNAKIAPYGIQIYPHADNQNIRLGTWQNLRFPLYKNAPMRLAMLKMIHIPARLYAPILAQLAQHNADNKYYVWPGTLQAAINQLIVMVNLTKSEYDALCQQAIFPLTVPQALQNKALMAVLDARTRALLSLIAQHTNEQDEVALDAPFLFEPYLVQRSTADELHGKPLLRVGDSIYNGNVKHGNGLGLHLQHLRHIQSVLQRAMSC